MSAPAGEPAPRPSPLRESAGGVVGVGLGLALIVLLALSLFTQRARTLDAHELFAGWFEPTELPFGLVASEAARQPGGERILLLEVPDAPEEAPRAEPPPKGAPGGAKQAFDWYAIPVGPEGTPPTSAALVTWPLRSAAKQLEALFGTRTGGPRGGGGGGGGGRFGDAPELHTVDPLAGLGPDGGRRVLERGEVRWGALDAPWALERKFEPGGTFVDTLRVNLSSEREALVLFLRWPRGLPGSEERARELLEHLVRRQAPAAAG